jgi:hypothetical protein
VKWLSTLLHRTCLHNRMDKVSLQCNGSWLKARMVCDREQHTSVANNICRGAYRRRCSLPCGSADLPPPEQAHLDGGGAAAGGGPGGGGGLCV